VEIREKKVYLSMKMPYLFLCLPTVAVLFSVSATAQPPAKSDSAAYTVTRIDLNDYRFDRKASPADLLSVVPGLYVQSTQGTQDMRLSIRGYGNRSLSGNRGVKILLDEVPENESEGEGEGRMDAVDLYSIGSVVVEKGNRSSLYANAPGGVIHFFNDMDFEETALDQFNLFGSFGTHINGIKGMVKSDHYRLLTTYGYQNYDGFRTHSSEYWNRLNFVTEVYPTKHSKFRIFGYYIDGLVRRPGSLTKDEFAADPYQADPRFVSRDDRRVSTKARADIRYSSTFGKKLNNDIEITTYAMYEPFTRVTNEYKIVTRFGVGLMAKYVNRAEFGRSSNEFSAGGELFIEPEREEEYENFGGQKSDQIEQLLSQKFNNMGIWAADEFGIIKKVLFLRLNARYDNNSYRIQEQTLPSRTDKKVFQAVTPKLTLEYKPDPEMSIFASYGLGFESPEDDQIESPNPTYLYNQDLKAQRSQNAELGFKGDWEREDSSSFFGKFGFEATLFYTHVDDEIVPYEVYGNYYFRNAAKTDRLGAEIGGELEIVKGLDLNLSYTWSHFRYGTYTAQSLETDSTGNPVTYDRDFTGNVVPSVPVSNLGVMLSYKQPIIKQISLLARLKYSGITGLYVDDANSEKTQGYNLLDGILGFDMKFGKFSVMLSGGVNNIFNEKYVGYTNTNSADKRFYSAGAPIGYFGSLNLGYKF
jgi:iron complex outermembrane recepter protein